MISLKSLMRNIKEMKLTKPRVGKETPMDANVQIPGYGVLTRKQMRGSILRYMKEVSTYIRKGDMEQAYSSLYKRGVLKGFLETEIQHQGKKL
jgi:hypothetical protein|tara:strand:+ start:948 stop:1226 length:279 start_codon:yes stop_codon:yes gene_type:complete